MNRNGLPACVMALTEVLCIAVSAAAGTADLEGESPSDGETPVPHGLAAENVTADSFRATWSTDGPVERFLFDCWSVSTAPWTGGRIWEETFSPCVNTSGNPTKLTEEKFDQYTDHAGWSGDFAYAPAGASGTIQVGKSDRCAGLLVSPGLPASEHAELAVRAKALDRYATHPMPVFLIRNGETNEVATFGLGTSFADFHCTVGAVAAGDRLAFKPYRNDSDRRVQIDSVALVEGFSPGRAVTNAVCEGVSVEYSETPGFTVENLAAGSEYFFSVRAVSGGAVSAPSGACVVSTKAADDIETEESWPGATALDMTHASFRLEWPPVAGAAGYRVSVWTNVLQGASRGRTVWLESFSLAPSAAVSVPAISGDEKFNEKYADNAGWTIASNVYPSVDSETVRIGNTSKPGELAAPPVPLSAGHTLRVLARRQSASEGTSFSAWLRSGETVSEIGEAQEIGEVATECFWTLPEMADEDRLVFRSASGKASYRTILDEVEILDGYSAGSPVPVHAVNAAETEETSFDVQGLRSALWTYAVEAVDGTGAPIAAATNRVHLENLCAVQISELPRSGGARLWREDFGAFTNVFPSTGNSAVWQNCTTLPHWQAYCGGTAVDHITRNHGAEKQNGLYAYWAASGLPSTYSLGTMTTGSAREFAYGIAFRNDTAFPVRKISVAYDGMQFGFRNTGPQDLAFEYLVTNDLASVAATGDWTGCANLTYRTTRDTTSAPASDGDIPVATALSSDISGATVPKDGYFVIRWRRSATTSAAAMAIDNVTVSFTVRSRPMTIVVR